MKKNIISQDSTNNKMDTDSIDSNIIHHIAYNLNNSIDNYKTESKPNKYVPKQSNNTSKPESKRYQFFKHEFKSFCCVLNYLTFKSFKFYSVKVYLVILCLITLFSSMIQGGYISAILVSIQTEFNLSITKIGLILSCFDIMSLFALPVVSYIGSKYNKPRIISILSFVYCIGAILFTFPFFFDTKYTVTNTQNSTEKNVLCIEPNRTNATKQCTQLTADKEWAYGLFICAQLLMSWGTAAHFSLGITFITDNTEEKVHALYTGIIYGAVALGPAIGYLLASFFLSKWLYLSDLAPDNLTTTDSNWVGAWYLGFIVSACCVFVLSLILITFPNKIKRTTLAATKPDNKDTKSTTSTSISSDPSIFDYNLNNKQLETIQEMSEIDLQSNIRPIDSVSGHLKLEEESFKKKSTSLWFRIHLLMLKLRLMGFFASFPRLLRNFRFTLLTLIISFEAILVSVFIHYMIIYSQSVYQLSESTSSILVGSIIVPSAIVGALLGGFIVNKFKLQIIGSTRLILASSTVVLVGILISLLIRCESTPSLGINVSQTSYSTETLFCNKTCTRCNYEYKPVCDSTTGSSYVSPCFAGCSNSSGTGYSNCSCTVSGSVNTDKCSKGCDTNLIIFLIVLFILVAAESICLTPITILLLKLIDKELHPFGLGVMRMANVLLANIPTPLLLSYGFSLTCILWKTDTCTGEKDKEGKCLEYNVNQFHFVLFGTLLGVKAVSWLLMIWFTIHIHRSYIFKSRYTNSITLNHDLRAPKAANQKKHNRQISSVPVNIDSLQNSKSQMNLMQNTKQKNIVLIKHSKTSSY